jgi:hypothetical protein
MASGSDDFSVDTLGTNWAVQTSESSGGVASGTWRATDTFNPCGHRRTAETYSGDHFVQATAKIGAVDREMSIRVRCQSGARSYYAAGYDNFDGGNSLMLAIWKFVGGTFTRLATHASQEIQNGDVARLTITGNHLSFKINTVEVLTADDASLSGGGPGLGGYSPTDPQIMWDDWSAADVGGASDTPRTPTVGAVALTGNSPSRVTSIVLTPQTP